jgi:hypothetical protein
MEMLKSNEEYGYEEAVLYGAERRRPMQIETRSFQMQINLSQIIV